ncbi:MAG: nicotinate-nucleotide adenylyltransferase [Blastocatellia bacterium]
MNNAQPPRRIGVYGGTFDPIHGGHLHTAAAISQSFGFDFLLLVPAFVPPHKRGRVISSPFHRYAMAALATASHPRVRLSTIELESPARPWTIDTMGRLRSEYGDAQLFFLMGGDSFADITSWRSYEQLLLDYHTVVALRPGYRGDDEQAGEQVGGHVMDAHLPDSLRARVVDLRGGQMPAAETLATPHIWLTDYVEVDVSSSEIREAARQGKPLADFTPPLVAQYIEKHSLYR